jgi:hypothetical protein
MIGITKTKVAATTLPKPLDDITVLDMTIALAGRLPPTSNRSPEKPHFVLNLNGMEGWFAFGDLIPADPRTES